MCTCIRTIIPNPYIYTYIRRWYVAHTTYYIYRPCVHRAVCTHMCVQFGFQMEARSLPIKKININTDHPIIETERTIEKTETHTHKHRSIKDLEQSPMATV